MKKFFAIGCSVLAVIIIVGGILICVNKDKIINFAVDKGFAVMESAIIENLPQSISQDSVQVLFDQTLNGIKSGEIDKDKLQNIVLMFQTSFKDKELDSLEVKKIINMLKKVGKTE